MEGICGIISLHHSGANLIEKVQAMAGHLSDGEALEFSSIFGEGWAFATGGWQANASDPITFVFQDEHLAIVGVADILNREELAARYRLPKDRTGELIAALCQADQRNWPLRLRGAFALVVFDKAQRKFCAATDRVGIRPLYWAVRENQLYFSSRLKSITRACRELEIDRSMVYTYAHYSMIPSPFTIYQDVQKLEPGFLIQSDGRTREPVCYWDISVAEKLPAHEREIADQIYQTVAVAVASMRNGQNGHTDPACFLSGGTDSSSICGLLTKVSSQPVRAISIGFPENGYDEMHYARVAAKAFDLEHHEYYMQPQDVLDIFLKIAAAYDEPYENASVFPAYHCARIAREQGAQYMFAGDGGDEIFAGNKRYGEQQIFRNYFKIPQPVRRLVLEPLLLGRLEKIPLSLFRKGASYIRRAQMKEVERIFSYRYVTDEERFSPDFLTAVDRPQVLGIRENHFNRLGDAAPLDRHLYMDMKLTITDNDLRKVTRMCELAGVRVRYPFLDHAVIELGFRIPARLKLKSSDGLRYIFKRAFAGLLPPEILSKKKHGFGLPISEWLRREPKIKEFAYDLLFDQKHLQRGYFKPEFIKALWRLQLTDETPYYGTLVYQMMMLELWHRLHVDS